MGHHSSCGIMTPPVTHQPAAEHSRVKQEARAFHEADQGARYLGALGNRTPDRTLRQRSA